MTISEYESITGTTVPASKQTFVTAQLGKAQRILESMLGFTLDTASYDDNLYTEIGKTKSDCPAPDEYADLDPPDAVVFAYRLYRYNPNDLFLSIDPATDVHAVKLVKDGVTYKTLDPDDYRAQYDRGLIKYLQQSRCWCICDDIEFCKNVQLAVDATWVWGANAFPEDLLDVWAQMANYYSDTSNDIRSETLGSHSYTKFDNSPPQTQSAYATIIKKYAGPYGSVRPTITL